MIEARAPSSREKGTPDDATLNVERATGSRIDFGAPV
jgi:hypothetical protein